MNLQIVIFIFLANIVAKSVQIPNDDFVSPVLKSNRRPNWFQFQDKIFYIDTVFKANFYKALQYCRQQGMHLFSINSEAENNRIGKFILDNGLAYNHYWTSANNLGGDRQWVWLSTGQDVVYTNWYPGEPNQAHNSTENCIEVRHWAPSGFTWNDLGCDAKLHFICESTKKCPSADTS